MNQQHIIKFLLICSIFLCSLVATWGQNDSIVQLSVFSRKMYDPSPVAPFNDTLFYINAGIGTFTPQDRAASITERIRNVSDDIDGFQADSLNVLSESGLVYIAYRGVVVMTITETDARLKGKTQLALTLECERIIRNAIIDHNRKPGWLTVMWRVFLVLAIIAAQYFLFRIVLYSFRKIFAKVQKLKGKSIKTLKFKSYKLMDEEKATGFILFLFKALRLLIILLMLYLSIPMALSIFPATRDHGSVLFGYVLTPFAIIFSGILGFIPDLIAIVIIVLVFKYLIKGLRFMTEEIDKGRLSLKGFYPDWAYPTFNIVKILLYAFMFIVIFPHLPGSESDVFKGVSVFIGVVFSLGSSSIIGNIVAGLVLTYMRPFKVGDRIKIGELVGNVVEKTPFVTRIRTPKNEEVTIPNSNIMSAQTFNYSHSAQVYGLILHTELTFGYDTPWRQVHELLLEAAGRTPDVMENPKPFILQTALDDFYAQYQLNVYVVEADKMAKIYSDLHQNVQDVFHEAGVEITSPHFQAHRDGSHSTLPTSYLPGDYQAPAFRVKVEK